MNGWKQQWSNWKWLKFWEWKTHEQWCCLLAFFYYSIGQISFEIHSHWPNFRIVDWSFISLSINLNSNIFYAQCFHWQQSIGMLFNVHKQKSSWIVRYSDGNFQVEHANIWINYFDRHIVIWKWIIIKVYID